MRRHLPALCSSRRHFTFKFSYFLPKSFSFSRKNLRVIARASRSFCWTFSSTIFSQSSGGRRLKSFSFLASKSAHKVNNSFFARALPFPSLSPSPTGVPLLLPPHGGSSPRRPHPPWRAAEVPPRPPSRRRCHRSDHERTSPLVPRWSSWLPPSSLSLLGGPRVTFVSDRDRSRTC